MNATEDIRRVSRRSEARFIPRQRPHGLVEVDATWGHIQPLVLAPAVETVGELEVIEQIERGLPLIDTRLPHFYAEATLPTAVNIPHPDVVARIGELDPETPAVFFCNGPQCSATPLAVAALLGAGYPAEAIRYYRGGIHDWMTLGLPVIRGMS